MNLSLVNSTTLQSDTSTPSINLTVFGTLMTLLPFIIIYKFDYKSELKQNSSLLQYYQYFVQWDYRIYKSINRWREIFFLGKGIEIRLFQYLSNFTILQINPQYKIPSFGQKNTMEKTHSFERHCRFVKDVMEKDQYRGKGNKEVSQILNNRIKKFYSTNDSIQVDVQHFKPRLEPLYIGGIEPSDDTLVLFGIDFMKRRQLRAYFANFQPNFLFIDQSNCMISFHSPGAALMAIKINVRLDSATRFKVEEDAEGDNFLADHNINLGHKSVQPREWIQLKPYIYRFSKNQHFTRQFQRKLYVRYATRKEKQVGFDKVSFIDEIINRCKSIWENEAKKDANIKLFLEKKLLQLNQAKKSFKQHRRQISKQCEENPRSRSRDKKQKPQMRYDPQKSIIQNSATQRQNSMMQGIDDDLSEQILSRAQSSNFSKMMEEFQNLDPRMQETNERKDQSKSIIGNISMFKYKDNTGMSGAPEIAYKLLQPDQIKIDCKEGKFDYKKYIQNSMDNEDKKKMVCFYDLTEDD